MTYQSRGQKCAREGCTRTLKPGSRFMCCTVICHNLVVEMSKAQRVCTEADNSYTPDLWASVVAFNDALTDLRRAYSDVYKRAMRDGFSESRWADLMREGPR